MKTAICLLVFSLGLAVSAAYAAPIEVWQNPVYKWVTFRILELERSIFKTDYTD